MNISTPMQYEKMPVRHLTLRHSTAKKLNNDITKMSTWEVLKRLYARHSVAVWSTLCVVTWVWIIWSKLGN